MRPKVQGLDECGRVLYSEVASPLGIVALLNDFFPQISPPRHEESVSFGEEDAFLLPSSCWRYSLMRATRSNFSWLMLSVANEVL